MTRARRCGLDRVALHRARRLGPPDNTTRQRRRAFYQEKAAKAGARRGCQRRDFEAAACFAPRLRWALSFWSCRRLALALDATSLGARFQVLGVSVLYGGIGIPVAWKVLPANQKEAGRPHCCGRPSGRTGPWSSKATAGWNRRGCSTRWSRWAGTPCCGSRPVASSAPPAGPAGTRSGAWPPGWAAASPPPGGRRGRRRRRWPARLGPAGTRGTASRGCCGPTWRPGRRRRAGTPSGPGARRGSRCSRAGHCTGSLRG